MKYILISAMMIAIGCAGYAQDNGFLIRHDTVLLKQNECEWIVRSSVKNDPASTNGAGKLVPQIIMQAIEKKGVKAYDPISRKQIPANKIYEWKARIDTVAVLDKNGNVSRYSVVRSIMDPSRISRIRILQDWYLDPGTDKLQSRIISIELMQELLTPSGMLIGYQPYCKIYY